MDEVQNATTVVSVNQDQGPKDRPEQEPVFDKLVKHCFGLYQAFSESDYRKAKLEEIKEARRVYEQGEDTNADLPFEDSSNLTMPLTAITIDQTEPRFTAALVGKEPYVAFEMIGLEKKDDGTVIVEDFFNKELKHTLGIVNETIGSVHDLLIDGTVFEIPKYVIDEETVKDFQYDQNGQIVMQTEDKPVINEYGQVIADPYTGQPLLQKVPTQDPMIIETTEIIHEGGKLERVPFNDMYYPDDCGTIEEWNNCDKIRRIYPTYAELQALKDKAGYMNIGPWLLKQSEGIKQSDPEKMQPGQTTDEVITGKETISCLECHVTYPIYQDVEKEKDEQTNFTEEKIILTIAEKSRMPIRLRLQRDIYWKNRTTIKRLRLFPEHGRSCGTGFYGKMKAIQQGASDMFNAVLDIAYVCMLPWFFYEDRSGLKGDATLRPGVGVKVDNVQAINIPTFNINPNQYLQFVQTFMGLWERLGSIGDWQIGRTNEEGGKRTATEVMTVIQEGNIRQNYQASVTRDEFVEVLQMLFDLYYQFMPLNKTFIFQGKPVQIPRKLMKRDYRFVLSGSSETANKMIERKEAEDMLQLFANDPLMDQMQLRKDVLSAYGKNNPEDYFDKGMNQLMAALQTNPELMQVIRAYLQQKAAAQPQGAEAAGGAENVARAA